MSDELHDFLDSFVFIYPAVSDTFAYATADTEKLYMDGRDDEPGEPPTNQAMLVDVWRKFGHTGIVAYVAKIRGVEPIKPLLTIKYREAAAFLAGWEYDRD